MYEKTGSLFSVSSLRTAAGFTGGTGRNPGRKGNWVKNRELSVTQADIACNTLTFKSAALWPLPDLETARAIPAALLQGERFAGRVRVDDRNNAIFPHFDLDGLCGYEIKNRGFTGFAKHGAKGLWLSHGRDGDNRLVLAESALDALSYAAMFPDAHARYGSIGGKPNPQQPELIRALVARLPSGSEVVAAMDNDADGATLAGVVAQAVQLSGRDDLRFVVHQPVGVKDWNDALREKQPAFPFPIARTASPEVR